MKTGIRMPVLLTSKIVYRISHIMYRISNPRLNPSIQKPKQPERDGVAAGVLCAVFGQPGVFAAAYL